MVEVPTDGPVLVSGATGTHGKAVVRALLAAGRPVRALTRNPNSDQARELAERGADVVLGDLLEAGSLTEAMSGVSAAYAVTTPFADGADTEIEQGEQIIAAASDASLPWLVLASVASADQATGVPHFDSKWEIERGLQASGLPLTIVAPTYFYENLGDPREKIVDGELVLPLAASQPLQQIALADLGAVVVSLLTRPQEFLGRRIELAGDDPTPEQMADALAAASGSPVHYRQIESEAIAARSKDLAAMYRFLADTGYHVNLAEVRTTFAAVKWTTFGEWIREQPIRPGTDI